MYWPWLHLVAEEYSNSTIGEFATNFLLQHGEAFIPEKPMGDVLSQVQQDLGNKIEISGLSEDV